MSKKFFRCPTHGPLDTIDLVGGDEILCRRCRVYGKTQVVQDIPEAWDNAFTESPLRAFLWASAVALLVLAAWFFFRTVAAQHDLTPWLRGLR